VNVGGTRAAINRKGGIASAEEECYKRPVAQGVCLRGAEQAKGVPMNGKTAPMTDRPHAEIIATYRAAERAQARARRSVTLIVIGVIAIHAGILVSTAVEFSNHRLPEFAAALSTEAANLTPRLVGDMRGLVNRLYPHYQEVFQQMFERDWATIEAKAQEEMRQLDQYAQQEWPKIEAGIVDVALTSEEVLQEELSRYISQEDARRIGVAYGVALEGKYNELLTSTFRDHVNVSREIGENLQRLMEAEPTLDESVSIHEATGLMLELMGVEMQKGL